MNDLPDAQTWATFETRTEMLAATALDDADLQGLTTQDLLYKVLDWPLYGDLFAFNSMQFGLERLIQDYNGLSELISRDDAGTVMLHTYQGIDPLRGTAFTDAVDRGAFTFQIAFFEAVMAHPSVLAHMDAAQRTTLLRTLSDKYRVVRDNLDPYSDLNLNSMALVMARTLRMEAPEALAKATDRDDWLDGFVDGRGLISREAADLLVATVDAHLSHESQR